jgi:hypothetical protein
MRAISKTLSANDIGSTGGHQAGILIPKDPEILSFFPHLDPKRYNPRCHILFRDDTDISWEFAFIYYNNALFGGTRNEYRLTRMTRFIREAALDVDDDVILTRGDRGEYQVSYKRKRAPTFNRNGVLKLGSGWKVINV